MSSKVPFQCQNWGMEVMYVKFVRSFGFSLLGMCDALYSHCCLIFTSSCMGQVRGIETVTTYDSKTGEFVINTPCESAQKYWIGGAALVRNFF